MSKFFLIYFLFSAFLILWGDAFILQRYVNADSLYMQVRDDSIYYMQMAEHTENIPDMDIHFKYRVMAPVIASLLPVSPLASLKIISYVSLFIIYFSSLLLMHKLNIAVIPALIALLLVFLSESNLFIYHNPFLVDAFQLMIGVFLLWFLYSKKFLPFLLFAVIGMLTKESIIFFILLWFIIDKKQGAVLLITSILILVLLRVFLGPSKISLIDSLTIGADRISHPIIFIKDIVVSWRYLWIIAFLGLLTAARPLFKISGISFIVLSAGAVLFCMFASDHLRMFALILPLMILISGFFLNYLYEQKYYLWMAVLTLYALVQSILLLPNNFWGNGSFEWFNQSRHYRVAFLIIGIILLSAFVLKEKKKLAEKFIIIFDRYKNFHLRTNTGAEN